MDDKKFTIKVWQIGVALILLIVAITAIMFLIKNENTNISAEEPNFDESKIVQDNENKSKNTHTIMEWDMVNDVLTEVEIDMDDIPQNTVSGYIPDQNLVKDNFTPFSEKEPEQVYNYDISNVSIEIQEGSLSKTGMVIKIIDNNETKYSWIDAYMIEVKNDNGDWQNAKMKTQYILWNEAGLLQDTSGCSWQEIDWSQYYGELDNGQYRLVKDTYDHNIKEHVKVFAEFEIK